MSEAFPVSPDLKRRYLVRKSEELAVCRNELMNDEFCAIRTLAHQLRGNAVSFEFPLFENLGILLGRSIEVGDSAQIREVLEDIQTAINGFMLRLSSTTTTTSISNSNSKE